METQSWDDGGGSNAFRPVYDVNTAEDNSGGHHNGYDNGGYHRGGGGGGNHQQYQQFNGNGYGGNGYSNYQHHQGQYNQYQNGGYHHQNNYGNDHQQMQHDHYQGYNGRNRNNHRTQRYYNRQRGGYNRNRGRGGRYRGNKKQYNYRDKRSQYQQRRYQPKDSRDNRFDPTNPNDMNGSNPMNSMNETNAVNESNDIDDIQRDVDALNFEHKEDPNPNSIADSNVDSNRDQDPNANQSEPSQETSPSRPTRPINNRFGGRKKKKGRRVIEDDLDYRPNQDDNETEHVDQSHRTQYVDESEPQMYNASHHQDARQFGQFQQSGQHSHHGSPPQQQHHHQHQAPYPDYQHPYQHPHPSRRRGRNAHDYELQNMSDRARKMAIQLKNGKYDCAICQSFIGKKARIWKCGHCYAIFHMTCINEWARAKERKDAEHDQRRPRPDRAITDLRCPACNFVDKNFKFNLYECYCGKRIFDHEHRSAYSMMSNVPHSCGEICGKKRGKSCPHTCPALCHPGPCEPCNLPSDRTSKCACGKMTYNLKCGEEQKIQRLCGQICDKLLKCGNHRCTKKCHEGPCEECTIEVEQECFCGKHTAMKPCGSGTKVTIIEDYKDDDDDPNDDSNDDEEKRAEEGDSPSPSRREVTVWKYSCKKRCGKRLPCGNHFCTQICHSGSCSSCPRRIETVTRCACGKTTFPELTRESCKDPLPTCSKKCGRMLSCGEHFCNRPCHDSPCNPCTIQLKKKCRCGGSTKTVSCSEYTKKCKQYMKNKPQEAIMDGPDSWIRCHKVCKRVKSCGKHTCKNKCCKGRTAKFYEGHICRIVCNKMLSCGKHRCSSFCHRGKCNPCGVTYRNGVQCACGNVFVPGPFQCGTKKIPACQLTCDKPLDCGHRCTAKCHEGACPPCNRICSRPCHSHNLMVHNMPCHVIARSCGNLCGKTLACGVHKCLRTCHAGPCQTKKEIEIGCGQTCNQELDCGHKCTQKCHIQKGDCKMFTCLAPITVECPCGSNSEKQYCRGRMKYEIEPIECTEQCQIIRRNARFREALNITKKSKKTSSANSSSDDEEKIRIPFAATVLRRILKWMKMDKAHSTFVKNQQKVYSPKFVQYLEGILKAFLSDTSDTAKHFKSQYPDIRPFINPATSKWTGTICLKPMNSEQRFITFCMMTAYHVKAEKVDNKNRPSFIELTKTKHSMIPEYLLSTALVEYQLHSHEIETLESMPPSSIIVVDDAESLSSSKVQDRLMAWVGDYRMYRNGSEQLYIVFTDENARNSAMTEMRKLGGRKATSADSFDASAVQKKSQERKRKKNQKMSKAQQQSHARAKAAGWTQLGNASLSKMPKQKTEEMQVKLGGTF